MKVNKKGRVTTESDLVRWLLSMRLEAERCKHNVIKVDRGCSTVDDSAAHCQTCEKNDRIY